MPVPVSPGITAETLATPRLMTRVLSSGSESGEAVLFLHGNLSSATWWEDVILGLPKRYRAIAYDQRGFGAADPEMKIDATHGLGDLADDAIALLDHLDIEAAHLVGQSMGGNVIWWLLRKYPERLKTVTLVAPGSPYGFGGTKDINGTPCFEDFAGSGAGLINPQLVERLEMGDNGTESRFSARSALRALIVKPPFVPEREDAIVASMLSTHIGEKDYPGDKQPSANWPYVAPGIWGVNNALSPKYVGDVSEIYTAGSKPPILWIRGADDLAVSDSAASDPGTLGKLGLIPEWPGEHIYPPQPMLAQIRAVLEQYAASGGRFREEVFADTGHTPYLEQPKAFHEYLHQHLKQS